MSDDVHFEPITIAINYNEASAFMFDKLNEAFDIKYILSNLLNNKHAVHNMIPFWPIFKTDDVDYLEFMREYYGADIYQQASNGCTSLIYACDINAGAIADYLISANIDVNIKTDTGSTAIMFARQPDIIQRLLEYGANANDIDLSGNNVIMYLCSYGKNGIIGPKKWKECLELLINAGADINHRNNVKYSIMGDPDIPQNIKNYMKELHDKYKHHQVTDLVRFLPQDIRHERIKTYLMGSRRIKSPRAKRSTRSSRTKRTRNKKSIKK
jgi:hypothetical protein